MAREPRRIPPHLDSSGVRGGGRVEGERAALPVESVASHLDEYHELITGGEQAEVRHSTTPLHVRLPVEELRAELAIYVHAGMLEEGEKHGL